MANLQQTGGGGGGTTLTGTGIARNTGACTELSGDVSTSGSNVTAVKTDLVLPGNPTTTTQTQANNSTRVATTAYVDTGLGTKQATLTGTGLARNTGASTELSGDVTTSGSNAATVVKVNGASVPVSATLLGSNGSGQLVDAVATSGLGVVLKASVNLSSAQINALFTTPITIVSAPGVGSGIVLLSATFQYLSGGTLFTQGSATTLQLAHAGLADTLISVTYANSGLGGTTNKTNATSQPALVLTTTNQDNHAVVVWLAGGNPSGGNGSMKIYVYYVIVPTT